MLTSVKNKIKLNAKVYSPSKIVEPACAELLSNASEKFCETRCRTLVQFLTVFDRSWIPLLYQHTVLFSDLFWQPELNF